MTTAAVPRVFYSFYFKRDVWRAARVRRIGDVAGNPQEPDSRWEVVRRGGDPAIRDWIDEQMAGMDCLIVLIGAETAGRVWVDYEIRKSWALGKGIIGIHVHRIADVDGRQTVKGPNPFDDIEIDGVRLSEVVATYDPVGEVSDEVYHRIEANLAGWVADAIAAGLRRGVPVGR